MVYSFEFGLTPVQLCNICSIRLKNNFAPYLFRKMYTNKCKESNGLWARPLVDAPNESKEITIYPKDVGNSMRVLDEESSSISPLKTGEFLSYDIEKLACIAYKFSRRSTKEIAKFVDYVASGNYDAYAVRQCITWHFDYHIIYYFSLLPEFYDKTVPMSWNRIYHEVIERGVWRDKVIPFICTMHENKFASVQDACMRMLTRESYWRCGAFGRNYEPPRYTVPICN